MIINNKNLSKKDEKFSFKNSFMLRISGIIIAIITAITLVGCNSKSSDQVEEVLEAWENTFELSNNQINEVFGFDEFAKTMENGTYTMSIDVPSLQSSFKVASKNSDEAQITLDVLGVNFLDLYANLEEYLITSDLVSGDVYKFNYEDIFSYDSEASKMFSYIMEDSDAVRDIFEVFFKYILNEYEETLKGASVKNLSKIKQEIDGKEVSIEGIQITLTHKDVAEMIIYTLETVQEDEFLKAYLAFNFVDVYGGFNNALEGVELELEYLIDKFKEVDSKENLITINSYLYNGYVAKAEIEIVDEEDSFIFTYETKGGSYPFENAIFNVIYNDSSFGLTTFGENTDEILKSGFILNIDGVGNAELSFEYNKNTNSIVVSDGYDSFTGVVNKLDQGKELNILLDVYGIDVEFNFVDTADVQIPTGDYINALELTDEEIEELADEIEENFYMILFSLLYGF